MARVLIVEDDTSVFMVARIALESKGHAVTNASNGQAAVDESMRDVPDVILMDMTLPGRKNGLDAAREIRANPRTKDVPIIPMTGLSSEEKLEDLRREFRIILTKPFKVADLVATVNNAVSAVRS